MPYRNRLATFRLALGADLMELQILHDRFTRTLARLRMGFEEICDMAWEQLPGADLDDELA